MSSCQPKTLFLDEIVSIAGWRYRGNFSASILFPVLPELELSLFIHSLRVEAKRKEWDIQEAQD